MSWRIKGQYKGLDKEASDFLKEFNRSWELKENGHVTTDALEQPKLKPFKENVHTERVDLTRIDLDGWAALEALLISIAGAIKSYSIPKHFNSKWRVRIRLKNGQLVVVKFDDLDSAIQAHEAIADVCFWISPS